MNNFETSHWIVTRLGVANHHHVRYMHTKNNLDTPNSFRRITICNQSPSLVAPPPFFVQILAFSVKRTNRPRAEYLHFDLLNVDQTMSQDQGTLVVIRLAAPSPFFVQILAFSVKRTSSPLAEPLSPSECGPDYVTRSRYISCNQIGSSISLLCSDIGILSEKDKQSSSRATFTFWMWTRLSHKIEVH